MKKCYLLFFVFVLFNMITYASPRYWVGPANGNWNDAANWAASSGGVGGAGVPDIADDVIFDIDASVNLDVSPVINRLRVTISRNVTLFTSNPTILTVNQSLTIDLNAVLKDSTSADVPFNFIFNTATNATGSVYGTWIFSGGVPVTAGNGASFTAEPGTQVFIRSLFPTGGGGGAIRLANNTGVITADPSSLIFGYNTMFVLDTNPEGTIPNATWYGDSLRMPVQGGLLGGAASTLLISGKMGVLKHAANRPSYGKVVVDLPLQTQDASLHLTNGSRIKGNLDILNTNNRTLTLLAPISPTSLVEVEVGTLNNGFNFAGHLNISGNTKVALAKSTEAAPGTSYRLEVDKSFNQAGGNFSLQDFDGARGSSTLAVKKDLLQTGGTFYTNSTSTDTATKFVVEMDDPPLITGPSGLFSSMARINMSSRTIDNGRNMVTLRINHSVYSFPTFPNEPNGVLLQSPLEVGRLELLRSPLTTTPANLLTVTDWNQATGIIIGNTSQSYVNGPMKRFTNSPTPYFFPTGKGNTSPASFIYDPCTVKPASKDPSIYQAEYFKTGFSDLDNISPDISGVSDIEYWDIAKLYGSDASIQLNLRTRVPGATYKDQIVVAYYESGGWLSGGAANGEFFGDDSSGSISSNLLSNMGPSTFGYSLAVIAPGFINCLADTTVNTDPDKCGALVSFEAEAGKKVKVVYKIGSTVITSPFSFDNGTTIVDVIASKASRSETCSFRVNVKDLQAPLITGAEASPATLSPVDNELKNVFIDYKAVDNCGTVKNTLSVTSNQLQTGEVDWEVTDEHNVKLRAATLTEDRIYTITITSTDEWGNKAIRDVTVTVLKENVSAKAVSLEVELAPNPSKTNFTLHLKSSSNKLITMQVLDMQGRIREVRRFYPSTTIRLGDNYRPGMYLVKFVQGTKDKYVTLVKLAN